MKMQRSIWLPKRWNEHYAILIDMCGKKIVQEWLQFLLLHLAGEAYNETIQLIASTEDITWANQSELVIKQSISENWLGVAQTMSGDHGRTIIRYDALGMDHELIEHFESSSDHISVAYEAEENVILGMHIPGGLPIWDNDGLFTIGDLSDWAEENGVDILTQVIPTPAWTPEFLHDLKDELEDTGVFNRNLEAIFEKHLVK